MFDFSTLESEFVKLEGYLANGATLVSEIPAALDTAKADLDAVKSVFTTLKGSVAQATQAVTAAVAVSKA